MKRKIACSLAGLLLLPIAGLAQDTTPAPAKTQPQELGTINVTGSAIPRTDVETPSPVTIITSEQIKKSGLTTVADVVRSISADNSGTIPTAFTLGFAVGSSGVALRGLTVNSTLVLIDGRRTTAYPLADDGQRSFTDLNTIPMNAVDRIEVLKDGASSLYGADAIAGVVNIILKKSFQGVQASAELGTSQHGGGLSRRATLLAGSGDLEKDGHNAYLNFEFQKDNPIYNRDRSFPFNTTDLSSIGGNNLIGGQPGQFSGSIYGSVTPGMLGTPGDLLSGIPLDGAVAQPLRPCGPGSTLVTNDPNNGGDTYCAQNFVDYLQVQPETERIGISGRFTMQLNDTTKAYLDASYFETKVKASGPPGQIQFGTPTNTNSIALPPTLIDGSLNPNNPFAAQGQYALINYAFGDLPQFGSLSNTNHNVRLTGDVNGNWGDWDYDTSIVLNHSWLDVHNYGFVNFDQLISDINDGSYSFIDPSQNTPAVRAALAPPLNKTSTTDMDAFDFHVSRQLWEMRGGTAGLALGTQWRYESQDDPDLNPNLAAQGLGIAHTIGKRNVSSLYAELDAPVLDSLEVNLSGRFDHYSDFGNNFSPKLGVKWLPIEMLALRGTYSKGFRAPSFAENGSSASEGFITYTVPDAFAALHGNNGYVAPYTLALLSSANPDIKPEKSKSFTFGAVVQPIPQFSASIDYYDIKKTGVIAQQSPFAALDAYFAGQPLPPGSAITPDRPDPDHPDALARPILVASEYINENSLKTSGIDLNLLGTFDFGNGVHWTSNLNFTKIISWRLYLHDGTTQQYVGTHGPYQLSSGAGTPRYRASWANSVSFGAATITSTFYHTSGLYLSAPDIQPGCFSTDPQGNDFPPDCRAGSFTYMDLTGSYDINEHVTMNGSLLNAFDRKPPFDPINYAAVNYNPTYAQAGIVGRFYTLGVSVRF